ncbi:MAG TPA: ATP-binding cassette domain-containing protein [Acidimicrobiales bacterium]|nr:ATP-binding cassette domain-containing protein [Acidimicrobiales bacterium]
MTYAIEAENLEKTFGGTVRALDGVSFAVEPGTVFGLLGPNGAGKTTAVRVLTTIVQPDAGSARVLGRDVVAEAGQVRSLIGLAGQYAAVDENLTGRENIFMVGRLNHLPRDVASTRAAELLERFGLSDAGDRTLKTYSGGMRRRLDLAAALVARPPVLFLDEPTTGLDLRSRNDLWEMIEGLVDGGTTVLLTTQYLEEADRLAQRVAVVDHGHVIAEGTPEQLKADLGATVLAVGLHDPAAAVSAAEILEKVGTKRPSVDGSSIELPVDDGPRAAMEALRLLDARDVVPTAFVLREPSLDDVFLALTGKRTEADDDEAEGATGDGARRRGRKGARAASTTGGAR